jgi:hypothetical protein
MRSGSGYEGRGDTSAGLEALTAAPRASPHSLTHTVSLTALERHASELEKRLRRHLRSCRGPWHVDETYVRVGGQWRYL